MEKTRALLGIQRDQFIEYLEYTEWRQKGTGDTPPIIGIHGVGGAMEMFRQFTFPAFERIGLARFIAINLPGYGGSSEVERHDLKACKDALLRFLNAKSIAQCHLLGVSWGGSIVLSFAADHPERVLTVTAQGAVYNGKEQFPWPVRRMWSACAFAGRFIPEGPVEQLLNEVRGHPWTVGVLGRALNRVDLKLLDQEGGYRETARESTRDSSLRALFENLHAVGMVDLTGVLPGIRVPTLITDGARTTNGSVRSSAGVVALLDPKVRHEAYIPGSGHLAPYTNPEAFGRILRQFIEESRSQGAHT